MREHFASAIAAEAEHGVERPEAERLTIERLGPAPALAGQLLADLRGGALGRFGRLSAAVTAPRLVALATVIAVAVAAAAGAVFAGKHASRAEPVPEGTTGYAVSINPLTGEVRPLLVALQKGVRSHNSGAPLELKQVWVVTPVSHRTRR
ncbi:MAG TPA: hypothetical protein VLJ44_08260 [Gaiellaceae bacterium]|nr:hypothetical protein [Gaiellaceae bacterium]